MTVSLCKTRIKEKWWFSQCGRTWLVCRKQLNTSGVTLNETKNSSPNTNDLYIWVHLFHTLQNCCNRGGNKLLSTLFPSLLPWFGSAFSLLKVPILLSIQRMHKSLVFGDEFLFIYHHVVWFQWYLCDIDNHWITLCNMNKQLLIYRLRSLICFPLVLQEKERIEAVSVGAILSDYQRVRVENV